MLGMQASEVAKAQIDAALKRGRRRMAVATAAGLVLGARVPIILTSRADPPEARLASVALAMTV